MRVVGIQPDAYDLNDHQEALTHILSKIDEAASLDPQLMVIPECVYPSYYLGLDEKSLEESMNQTDEVIARLAEKAVQHQSYIAFGLVVREDDEYYNRGLLFNPNGDIVSTVNKSFMWHFDNDWFSYKPSQNIVDTPFGKWGMIICADGRMPEIVRDLALEGVDLIIDLANLTSTGKVKENLTNAQSAFMLSTRAFENNFWFVMADKVGVEANTVAYSGRSSIIAPDGEVVVEATADQEEIIYADINVNEKSSKEMIGLDVLADRRPDTYGDLVKPHEQLPISQLLNSQVVPTNLVIQGSSVQFPFEDQTSFLEKANHYIHHLEAQGSNVIVLPQVKDVIPPHTFQNMITKPETIVFVSVLEQTKTYRYITLYGITQNRVEAYRKVHLNRDEQTKFSSGHSYTVIQTDKGNFGVMIGEDGYFPEAARALTLNGADCIIWINDSEPVLQEKVARTRAAENKTFVMTANNLNRWQDATSMTCDPNGNIIAATLIGQEQATAMQVPLVLARCKEIVPGTNAVLNRKPEDYTSLVKENSYYK